MTKSLTASSDRILVVDDLEDNRAVLVRPLARRGFQVFEADRGVAALKLLAHQEIDLVLLDILMPGMNGMEVLRHIRAEHSLRELPILMVSALTEGKFVDEAQVLGANGYITKPVDLPVALARIQRALAPRRGIAGLSSASYAGHLARLTPALLGVMA